MPVDPSMFGMGGPGGPGGADPGMMTPGAQPPMAGPAMDALGQLAPKSPNPTAAMQKVDEAITLAYRLITTIISQVQQMNPKAAKDGHAIARSLLNMKSDLHKDAQIGPPPDLMMGMGGAGAPAAMGPPPATGAPMTMG